MATKKSKKQRKELLIGLCSLVLGLTLLVVFALCLPRPQKQGEPTTAPTLLAPNPYGADDFAFENGYLTCLAGPSVLGLDVSAHQGVIDWQQVKDAGFSFVMIRVGYRGYETGELHVDTFAQSNYAGAKAAGLQVGAYFFSQALNEEEALAEADLLLSQISHWELDMPVVYDWEYVSEEARTGSVTPDTVLSCTTAFLEAVEQAGYRPMVYFNPNHAQTLLDLEQLAEYPFWLALYSDRMTFTHRVDMWQYTQEGTVPGIEVPVDIDLWFPYTEE
jgi:GH25 family lysozyme M1 (1,4-beta-N-acetylmuramidase)